MINHDKLNNLINECTLKLDEVQGIDSVWNVPSVVVCDDSNRIVRIEIMNTNGLDKTLAGINSELEEDECFICTKDGFVDESPLSPLMLNKYSVLLPVLMSSLNDISLPEDIAMYYIGKQL